MDALYFVISLVAKLCLLSTFFKLLDQFSVFIDHMSNDLFYNCLYKSACILLFGSLMIKNNVTHHWRMKSYFIAHPVLYLELCLLSHHHKQHLTKDQLETWMRQTCYMSNQRSLIGWQTIAWLHLFLGSPSGMDGCDAKLWNMINFLYCLGCCFRSSTVMIICDICSCHFLGSVIH